MKNKLLKTILPIVGIGCTALPLVSLSSCNKVKFLTHTIQHEDFTTLTQAVADKEIRYRFGESIDKACEVKFEIDYTRIEYPKSFGEFRWDESSAFFKLNEKIRKLFYFNVIAMPKGVAFEENDTITIPVTFTCHKKDDETDIRWVQKGSVQLIHRITPQPEER